MLSVQPAFLVKQSSNLELLHRNTWKILTRKAASFVFQNVEYKINKGVLGLTKEVSHKVWEFKGPTVAPHNTKTFHDLHKYLQVPVMPPTLADICKVLEIYYILKVGTHSVLGVCLKLFPALSSRSFFPL